MRHKPTVLIVDDDSDMRVYCAKALESEGYRTIVSSNAAAALDALGRQPINLLITDFLLGPPVPRLAGHPRSRPVLTGVGLMQKALAGYPDLRVVLMSAYGDQLLHTPGMDPKKQPMLRKPFHAESLRLVVHEALHVQATPAAQQDALPEAVLVPRAHPRFQVNHAVIFTGRVEGQGVVSNLSLGGCHIQSSHLVRPDTYLTVLLTLPDIVQPLKINVAVVRWTRPGVFGLEFRYVEQSVRERLARYLSMLSQCTHANHD
ncbi:MAG TPA: PilZ domain-containing protein [Nitrospiraceae bacterium]|nr:PilZ domain-containing protein [Nitrospiraceae bacterium]